MAQEPNKKAQQNGYTETNKLDDNDIENESKILQLLELGLLKHHEIENFFMDEEKIEKACNPVSWSNCDATTFEVRKGPNYTPGFKAPSKKALYEVFSMDAYKVPFKIQKIFKYIKIEKYIKKYSVPYDKDKFPLPPLFILNIMIPNYAPELMGDKLDGEGYQIILYAHISKEIRSDLLNNKFSPSIKLLSSFIHSDLVNSEIRNRFKVIARIMNTQYTNFGFLANRLVRRYNGKPFLARTSSTFYHIPGKYFAADIDAHKFGYPARQGLSYVKSTIHTAIYDCSFVIEGKENNELPEQILACCRIQKMGVELCKPFPLHIISNQKETNNQKNNNQKETNNQKQKDNGHQNIDDNDDNDDNLNTDKNGNSNESSGFWRYFGLNE